MSTKQRTMRVDSVDERGVFEMTLATEGEASDGDILSIAGGQIPERMPLLLSHYNDPTAKAGSVTNPRKELKHSPPRLRSTGQIEMGGVGVLAEIRRDVAMMTNKHGGDVSIRWDEVDGGDPPIRRVNLPSDHPYFVDDSTEKSWKKRYGLFWPSWKAIEGSIVAVGADPDATVGGRLCAARAKETTGEVSAFWRAMAKDAEQTTEEDPEPKPEETLAIARRIGLGNLCKQATQLRSLVGTPTNDLINAVTLEDDGQDFTLVTIGDEEVFLPQRLADQLTAERKERAEITAQPTPEPDPEPEPARADPPKPKPVIQIDPERIAIQIATTTARAVSECEAGLLRKVNEKIDRARGVVK